MKTPLSIGIDLRTARLVRVCQGVEQANLFPADAARLLVRHAKGVRLFAESGDPDLMRAALDAIRTLCNETEADDKVLASLRAHVGHTRKAIDFEHGKAKS